MVLARQMHSCLIAISMLLWCKGMQVARQSDAFDGVIRLLLR